MRTYAELIHAANNCTTAAIRCAENGSDVMTITWTRKAATLRQQAKEAYIDGVTETGA